MLSLAAPWYLLGLLLLPVIRWLHRGGRHRRAVPVSHLGLWRGAAARRPAAGRRRPPDPAWRRRALWTALLFIALAGPHLPRRQPPITLWIDDSLSMLTREGRGTRLSDGVAKARLLLEQTAGAELEVRTLSDPWRKRGRLDEASVAAMAAEAGRQPSSAPPAALLAGDHRHWLLSDGSHAELLDWPDGRQPDRVIATAASVTRNVGLRRLSAQRSPSDPDRVDLLVELSNGGDADETRSLLVSADGTEVARTRHRLEPGASMRARLSMAAASRVHARLEPGDALAEDDEIALDLAALRRARVAIDAACPAALRAAVSTHPALAVAPADAADVQARLRCSADDAAPAVATLMVLAERMPTAAQGALQWSSSVTEAQRIRLDGDRLRFAARLSAGPDDAVLLAASGAPLVVRRGGPVPLLETALDFEAMATAPGPETPLLVNLLFEQLLGRRLLGDLAISERGTNASVVVPAAQRRPASMANLVAASASAHDASASLAASSSAAAAAMSGAPTSTGPAVVDDWTRPLLLAALLVLLWELAALVRQWAYLRRDAEPP